MKVKEKIFVYISPVVQSLSHVLPTNILPRKHIFLTFGYTMKKSFSSILLNQIVQSILSL